MNVAPKNLLLTRLPDSVRTPLLKLLEPVALPLKKSLYKPEQPPLYVHFLTSGMASIVTRIGNGETSEVGLVGREGMPESLHLLGPGLVQTSCFMQLAGTGLRMRFNDFQDQLSRSETLRRIVWSFVQYQGIVLGQVAACNRLHDIEGRMARWLLMANDQTDEEQLPLTHEFLSEMLGARRSSITVAAGKLQDTGIIDYRRGHARILDRERLITLACECYQITSDTLQRFKLMELAAGPSRVSAALSSRSAGL